MLSDPIGTDINDVNCDIYRTIVVERINLILNDKNYQVINVTDITTHERL